MNRIQGVAIATALLGGVVGFCQSQPKEDPAGVPLTAEAHHHLVFSNKEVRAFYVVIPSKDRTLIHRHDVDYVWVGIGNGKVVNVTVNGPTRHLDSKDAALHFTRGPLAHFALNEGGTLYRNVTIELLKKQNNPRNLCDQVIEGEPTACTAATSGEFILKDNVRARPEFETDEIRFDLLTLGSSEQTELRRSETPPLVVALDNTTAEAIQRSAGGSAISRDLKDGNVMSPEAGSSLTLKNTGASDARFLVFEFKN